MEAASGSTKIFTLHPLFQCLKMSIGFHIETIIIIL